MWAPTSDSNGGVLHRKCENFKKWTGQHWEKHLIRSLIEVPPYRNNWDYLSILVFSVKPFYLLLEEQLIFFSFSRDPSWNTQTPRMSSYVQFAGVSHLVHTKIEEKKIMLKTRFLTNIFCLKCKYILSFLNQNFKRSFEIINYLILLY